VLPYRAIRRAHALYDMGFIDPAMAEAEAALKVMPAYEDAFKILGDGYYKKHDLQKAFENYRLACAYDGNNAQYRRDLAQAYLDLNNTGKAVEQIKLAMELQPESLEGKFLQAKSFLKNKHYKQGCAILVRILTDKKDKDFSKRKALDLFKASVRQQGKK